MSSPSTEPGRAAIEVTMPETGSEEGAVLISWLKGPGSPVQADEPICIVRVGELTAEIVSPSTGVVGGIYADTGQQIPPGASLAEVLPLKTLPPNREPEQEPADASPASGGGDDPIEFKDPLANLASEIEALELTLPDLELQTAPQAEPEPDAGPEPEPERSPIPPPAPPAIDLARFRSPAVRRLASEHGVDLADVRGTGRGGRITRTDVLAAAAEG